MAAPGLRIAIMTVSLTGIEMRGPDFRGFTADGAKTLFRFARGRGPFTRLAILRGADRRAQHGGVRAATGRHDLCGDRGRHGAGDHHRPQAPVR